VWSSHVYAWSTCRKPRKHSLFWSISKVSWWDFPCFASFLQSIFLYPIFFHPPIQTVSVHPLILESPTFRYAYTPSTLSPSPLSHPSLIPEPHFYVDTSYPPLQHTFGHVVQSSCDPFVHHNMNAPLHQTWNAPVQPTPSSFVHPIPIDFSHQTKASPSVQLIYAPLSNPHFLSLSTPLLVY